MSYYEDVGEFHTRFGLDTGTTDAGRPTTGRPRALTEDEFLFRFDFLLEELHELLRAHRANDVPGVADAIVDLVYVALGTAHLMHLPLDAVWAEVQRANLDKRRASADDDPRSKRGHALDVVKPEGWRPPDVAGVLRRYGFRGALND